MPDRTMLSFLRTRLGQTALFLALAMVAALGLMDRVERLLPVTAPQAGMAVLEENLARAAALFATARALNAAVSVLQSAEVTAGVSVGAGVEGTIVPGQALDPVNDLVERFSAVMLSATVTLGAAMLLVQAGDVYGFQVLLPLGLLLAALALWVPGAVSAGARRAGLVLVMAALIAKLGLPLAVLGTEVMAERLVQPQIEQARGELEAIDLPRLPMEADAAEKQSWLDRLKAVGDVGPQIARAAASAADLADTVVALTVAYIVKILVLPILLLWLIGRTAELLLNGILPRRE